MSFFFLNVFLKIANLYQKIVKNYLTFLPHSPATKLGLNLFQKISVDVMKLINEPDIKKVTNFYIKNHEDIQDTQGIYKIMFLLQCMKETEHLEGDIIELGSYKGGNAIMIAKFLKQIGSKKKVYACDTFSGIPEEDSNVKDIADMGYFSDTNLDAVKKKLKKYDVFNVKLVIGDFRNTLPKLDKEKFSLVFIDCNIFSSAKLAINFSYPRLVKDGVLFSHCYGAPKGKGSTSLWGETYAVKEYLSNKLEKIVIESIPFMQKGHNPPKIINKMPKSEFSTYHKPD